jgi:hypothetical protein
VNVAVSYNFVAVEGRQMAVIFARCGSELVLGSGNTAPLHRPLGSEVRHCDGLSPKKLTEFQIPPVYVQRNAAQHEAIFS